MADQQNIKQLLESVNVAENLDKDKLNTIGSEAKRGFDADLASRKEWEDCMDDWIKLAKQFAETKTYPWTGAANVKYPLLSTAAMQFAARAYPSLLPSDRSIVKATPIGSDLDGQKHEVAQAVSTYMSYQLMEEMTGWEEDMDKMLIMLPIIGTMFKKTYWDSIKKVNCSVLVLPKNLVVDYWARNLRDAERISEVLFLSKRRVKERQLAGLWLDEELGRAQTPEGNVNPPPEDDTTPYTFVEQHTYLDLDDDGYAEPYIITFQRETGKVFRIVPRFDDTTITFNDKDKVVKIEPVEYYTKFGFVPNPDGGFYDIGFGVLLGPLNESVNTIINQLLDAGHLHSLQGGFLGKGLRLRLGETQFKPGEWKAVNATGGDLKQQILPLPTKEPSTVLFQLMGSLITSGKELASVAEIFVGKMPGQNTPATTTMASIEQGMKVFTAVYKRIYRSLGEEFNKLYRLNAIYLNPNTTVEGLVDISLQQGMFEKDQHKVYPGADPTAISQTEKLMKAQGLMELLGTGVLDTVKVVTRVLQAQEQPNWKELLNPQVAQSGQVPPKMDPKVQALQLKAQTDQAAAQQDMQAKAQEAELNSRDKQQQMEMAAQEHAMKMQSDQREAELKAASLAHADAARIAQAQSQARQNQVQGVQTLIQNHVEHQQKMVHNNQAHQQKVAQMRQTAKAKPKSTKKGNT